MKSIFNNYINRARSKMLRFTVATGVVLLSTSTLMAFQDEGTIRIGMLETITGGAAPYGLAGARGTLLAIEEVNATGGIEIDGKKVKNSCCWRW
jgi:ABC-type branched-subunit amino acid transport system substrate-binding protein